jgi:hypothetical protein
MKYNQIKQMAEKLRKIPLIDIIINSGAIRDKYDQHKFQTSKGTISITGQKFKNWSLGKGGGGSIDLVMHLYQLDFCSAVIWLSNNYYSNVNSEHVPILTPEKKTKLILPENNERNLPIVISYLNQERKIPINMIRKLINSGKLYADDKANAVFPLTGKNGKIEGAELRGTGEKQWRGMAAGTKKNMGAFSVKSTFPENLVICESAIDAISYFVLNPNCIAVSTSGVTSSFPGWLYEISKNEIKIYCGFDDDEAGNRCAEKMITMFPEVQRKKPEKHDWNDVLKLKVKKLNTGLPK